MGATLVLPTALSLLLAACDDSHGEHEHLTLTFAPLVNGEPFVCGDTYDNLGASGDQSLTIRDARFYAHNFRVVDANGNEFPIELEQDGTFQHGGLAYIDFSDSSLSGCEGNPQTRTTVVGTAPLGSYVALRFTVGVPFEDNHADASVAASPLNVTDMFWAWQSGYKFMRLDGASTGLPDWRFHLGSTGCMGDPTAGGVTSCAAPNRVEVEIRSEHFMHEPISVDFGALLSDVDLDTQTENTPPGCMSGAMDPDCTPYFEALGLPHGTTAAGTQRVFSLD